MDTIQVNKFSHLHDGDKVFFCKTDYLSNQFREISKLKHDVLLISGNSDYCITDNHIKELPSNVKFWFAHNCLVDDDRVHPLPMGIENQSESALGRRHGVSWGGRKREILLSNIKQKPPTKFAYSNFRVWTNSEHRSLIRDICIEADYIDWENPSLTNEGFYNKCLDYELVVCAQGNGPGDNHRIYETLYLERIPITFNQCMYKKLHHNFPVICLDDPNKLKDKKFLDEELKKIKSKTFNRNMLHPEWWINEIKNKIELL